MRTCDEVTVVCVLLLIYAAIPIIATVCLMVGVAAVVGFLMGVTVGEARRQ